ncbi:MAG: hypothetical protein JOZ07_01800 [Solirubrobacterales bacterium]|nr:hypothetical protein [Solirubrobacterales bacterium]
MALEVIVSYDGTTHDDDALMLGRMLAAAGASLSLAYVRHAREYSATREEIAQHDADRRLAQGAIWLGDESVPRHVVVNPSTSAGLASLAASQGAGLIVFGSDYRTTPGHVQPGGSAQGLLENGSVAVAVAAAGLRVDAAATIRTISVAGDADGAAAQTAAAFASPLGAEVLEGRRDADLIVVDSRASAPAGRIGLDGTARGHLDSARGSVLVLPRDRPLSP